MTCEFPGCPKPAAPHVHLTRDACAATANVLVEEQASRAFMRVERIARGWRRCPDGVWRIPADWPALPSRVTGNLEPCPGPEA